MNSKNEKAPNTHLAPYITPHVETTFHSIIHSYLNRGAPCRASNREKYENRIRETSLFLPAKLEEKPTIDSNRWQAQVDVEATREAQLERPRTS
jgi:hypothetical protein